MQQGEIVTVVIPTHNEIGFLPILLRCLERQTFTEFTVVVVDNHSVDGTRQFCQSKGIRVIDGGHPGHARNRGAEIASTEYILFLDADVVLPNDFIALAIAHMEKLGAGMLSFELISSEKNRLVDFLFRAAVVYFRIAQRFGFSHCVGGAVLVKKSVHAAVDGFDESITVAEDHDYANRISKAHKYVFLRQPKVMVSARRLEHEGFIRYSLKMVLIEVSRIFGREIRADRIGYF